LYSFLGRSFSSDRYSACGKRPLTIAAMNAELHPFKNGEHNSESASAIERVIASLKEPQFWRPCDLKSVLFVFSGFHLKHHCIKQLNVVHSEIFAAFAPNFVSRLNPVTVKEGESVMLRVTITGTNPEVTWYREGAEITPIYNKDFVVSNLFDSVASAVRI